MRTVIPIVPVKAKRAAAEPDGWAPLSTLSEPRLTEMAENYRRLGYEVQIRDVLRNEGGCYNCFDVDERSEQVIGTLYVRRRPEAAADDELFP